MGIQPRDTELLMRLVNRVPEHSVCLIQAESRDIEGVYHGEQGHRN